jgi:hypothetical protein
MIEPPVQVPRGAPIAAVASVLLLDAVLERLPPHPLGGILDETAHLLTATVVLAVWPRPDAGFARGLAAGSVLIDVDHVPELWRRITWLRPRGVRPRPHTLLTPALVARAPGRLARGAAVGLALHLGRDLATGRTGVALLWPLSRRAFSIRYRTYLAALAVAALTASRGSAPRRPASRPGSPPPPAPWPAPGRDPGSDGP